MASNQDNSKKTKRGPPQPWIVNSFGISSPSSSKPPKQRQRTLMSAPAFAISPRGGGGAAPSKSTRGDHDGAAGDQADTPVKKLRREGDVGLQVVEDNNSVDTELGSAAESSSTSTRPHHPLAQPTPLVHRPSPKPLTTTPSRHLPPPPPPAYHLPRPPPGPSAISPHHPSKPLSRISDLLPSPLAPSPIKPDPSLEPTSVKKKPLTVGLSGIAAGKIRVGEEGEGGGEGSGGGGGGGGMIMGVDEWALGMLNGKSPSKGKKAFKGILPLTSSTSLLLSSHSTSLKHFFAPPSNTTTRRPQADLHLLVLNIAPPEPLSNAQLNPRLLRTICRILPPPRPTPRATTLVVAAARTEESDPFAMPPPPTTATTSNDDEEDVPPQPKPAVEEEDDEMEEEESIGTVLLMLPADGSLGVGRKEGVGVGKTVRGWRPWLEVDVGGEEEGEGGERVLMLDRFEVE